MTPGEPSIAQARRKPRGDGKYCRRCHYALTGLPSPGQCPECGCDFDFTLHYSYEVEPHPPTIVQRLLSRRMLALWCALALEALAVWIVSVSGVPTRGNPVGFFLAIWTFIMIWLLLYATGLDVACDEPWHFLPVSGLIGALIFIPIAAQIGWGRIVLGLIWGVCIGLVLYRLKETRWLG